MADKTEQILTVVIAIVIGFLILAYVFPIGLNAYYDANTTGWDSATLNIWDTLSIFAILVVLGVFAGWVIKVFK